MGSQDTHVRICVVAAWEKVPQWMRSPILAVRPRVSLLSGSVLVLLTLFLPVAYEACGPNKTGREFIRDEGIWPGAVGLVVPLGEQAFYILALCLAAFTIPLVLIPWRRRDLLRRRSLVTSLFVIAGSSSLYLLADFFWVYLWLQVGGLLEKAHLDDDIAFAPAAVLTIGVLAWCLRFRFLRQQLWIVCLIVVQIAAALALTASLVVSQISGHSFLGDRATAGLLFAPSTFYWLVPLVLWYRFGLSCRTERQARWPGIRRRIVQMFVPVAAIDALFLVGIVRGGVWETEVSGLWGFPVFFIGLHLISFGYMQLRRELHPARSNGPAGNSSG